jgi:hypothetical protein
LNKKTKGVISFEIGAREKMSHIKKELCYNVLQNSRINRKQTKVEPNNIEN